VVSRITGRTRRILATVGAPALLVAITWADYASGYEFGSFVFYFAPIALAAWYGGRPAAVVFAVLAGAGWYASDVLSRHPYSNALLVYWEAFIRLVSFLIFALALAKVREDVRRREELLDVISHDLRAPLGALVGQAQLLRKRADRDDFAAGRIEAILRCASRMNTMIEDLLDAARESSEQLELRLEPIPIGPYLAELVERFAPLLEPGRVRVAVAGGPLVAHADPGRLDRIVLNLLLNALKFSPPESPVELGAAREGGRVAIRVADRGPGIAREDLPHLFDRYYRGRRASAAGGLGIGLYSVRLLVEAHGGSVRVEPGASGGTTFVVSLAASAAPESPAVPAGTTA
jgi:signal transduction histidine kinase